MAISGCRSFSQSLFWTRRGRKPQGAETTKKHQLYPVVKVRGSGAEPPAPVWAPCWQWKSGILCIKCAKFPTPSTPPSPEPSAWPGYFNHWLYLYLYSKICQIRYRSGSQIRCGNLVSEVGSEIRGGGAEIPRDPLSLTPACVATMPFMYVWMVRRW